MEASTISIVPKGQLTVTTTISILGRTSRESDVLINEVSVNDCRQVLVTKIGNSLGSMEFNYVMKIMEAIDRGTPFRFGSNGHYLSLLYKTFSVEDRKLIMEFLNTFWRSIMTFVYVTRPHNVLMSKSSRRHATWYKRFSKQAGYMPQESVLISHTRVRRVSLYQLTDAKLPYPQIIFPIPIVTVMSQWFITSVIRPMFTSFPGTNAGKDFLGYAGIYNHNLTLLCSFFDYRFVDCGAGSCVSMFLAPHDSTEIFKDCGRVQFNSDLLFTYNGVHGPVNHKMVNKGFTRSVSKMIPFTIVGEYAKEELSYLFEIFYPSSCPIVGDVRPWNYSPGLNQIECSVYDAILSKRHGFDGVQAYFSAYFKHILTVGWTPMTIIDARGGGALYRVHPSSLSFSSEVWCYASTVMMSFSAMAYGNGPTPLDLYGCPVSRVRMMQSGSELVDGEQVSQIESIQAAAQPFVSLCDLMYTLCENATGLHASRMCIGLYEVIGVVMLVRYLRDFGSTGEIETQLCNMLGAFCHKGASDENFMMRNIVLLNCSTSDFISSNSYTRAVLLHQSGEMILANPGVESIELEAAYEEGHVAVLTSPEHGITTPITMTSYNSEWPLILFTPQNLKDFSIIGSCSLMNVDAIQGLLSIFSHSVRTLHDTDRGVSQVLLSRPGLSCSNRKPFDFEAICDDFMLLMSHGLWRFFSVCKMHEANKKPLMAPENAYEQVKINALMENGECVSLMRRAASYLTRLALSLIAMNYDTAFSTVECVYDANKFLNMTTLKQTDIDYVLTELIDIQLISDRCTTGELKGELAVYISVTARELFKKLSEPN